MELTTTQPIQIMGFKERSTQQIKQLFQLTTLTEMPELTEWLNAPSNIPPETVRFLDDLSLFAKDRIWFWNEDELKLHFIFPFMHHLNLRSPHFSVFAERPIRATFDNSIQLRGTFDLLIASGEYEPELPYFCFHEYKKEKGTADDPIAQLLCAMLVGWHMNEAEFPIYGVYVVGRNWFFVVLKDNTYAISNVYSITRIDDLKTIFSILKYLEILIPRNLNPTK
ncbi:MAG: hypothetical protein AAF798_02715 [Bacteroidota bacterium]